MTLCESIEFNGVPVIFFALACFAAWEHRIGPLAVTFVIGLFFQIAVGITDDRPVKP